MASGCGHPLTGGYLRVQWISRETAPRRREGRRTEPEELPVISFLSETFKSHAGIATGNCWWEEATWWPLRVVLLLSSSKNRSCEKEARAKSDELRYSFTAITWPFTSTSSLEVRVPRNINTHILSLNFEIWLCRNFDFWTIKGTSCYRLRAYSSKID